MLDPDPDATTEAERDVLGREAARLNCRVFTVRDFVEKVLFTAAYDGEATLVEFDLPYDLSRLAIESRRALPVHHRNWKGETVQSRPIDGWRLHDEAIGK